MKGGSPYTRLGYGARIAAAFVPGIIGGFCLFAIALVSYLLGDRLEFVREYGSPGSLLKMYLLGGGLGGLIGGVLSPAAKHLLGAILVGTLAALPMMGAVVYQLSGPISAWDGTDYGFVLFMAALVGGGAAVRLRKAFLKDRRDLPCD